MSDCDVLETVAGGFAIYGLMWIIIFFLLLIRHLVIHEPEAKTTNPDKASSDGPDQSA